MVVDPPPHRARQDRLREEELPSPAELPASNLPRVLARTCIGTQEECLQGPALSKFWNLLTEQVMKQSVWIGGSAGSFEILSL